MCATIELLLDNVLPSISATTLSSSSSSSVIASSSTVFSESFADAHNSLLVSSDVKRRKRFNVDDTSLPNFRKQSKYVVCLFDPQHS
jgi:hypothetical protein